MTFDELQQIVQNLASTTAEAHWRFQEDLQAMRGRHEALEKLVTKIAEGTVEAHWKFQEGLRGLNGSHEALEKLVFQIAEGTARLLTTVESHEARLSRLEGTE
jgi:hypothetical protein